MVSYSAIFGQLQWSSFNMRQIQHIIKYVNIGEVAINYLEYYPKKEGNFR